MKKSIVKNVFDEACKELVFDQRLLKKINQYQVWFLNKNEDHIAFFGGHLLGAHKVRFNPSDEDRWFADILDADPSLLDDEITKIANQDIIEYHQRRETYDGINPEFQVSSDIFNLSCVWLVHKIFTSPKLNDRQKEDGMIDVLLVLHYRYITSRIVRHFPFSVNPEIAEATHNQLSGKYAIKQEGTWYNVLRARAIDIISHNSIHRKCIEKMNDDADIVKMLNDTQGRIRAMVKGIHTEFSIAHSTGLAIASSSDLADFDGDKILKDKTGGLINYMQYIKACLGDPGSFIKEDLVVAIEAIMKTMPPRLFRMTLEGLSKDFGTTSSAAVENVVELILTHSFSYLAENRSLVRGTVKLPGLLARLKGVYTSSRSTDPELLVIRDKVEDLVMRITGNKNKNVLASVRTGVMLYIVGRTYTKNHYG